MLIDKGIAPNEIISIKIISGEEIVGKLIEENDKTYKLSKPSLINITERGLIMIPYLFSADMEKPIDVFKTGVVSVFVTEKNFANQYIQGTTGLKLA
jgi:hypothetical protein